MRSCSCCAPTCQSAHCVGNGFLGKGVGVYFIVRQRPVLAERLVPPVVFEAVVVGDRRAGDRGHRRRGLDAEQRAAVVVVVRVFVLGAFPVVLPQRSRGGQRSKRRPRAFGVPDATRGLTSSAASSNRTAASAAVSVSAISAGNRDEDYRARQQARSRGQRDVHGEPETETETETERRRPQNARRRIFLFFPSSSPVREIFSSPRRVDAGRPAKEATRTSGRADDRRGETAAVPAMEDERAEDERGEGGRGRKRTPQITSSWLVRDEAARGQRPK